MNKVLKLLLILQVPSFRRALVMHCVAAGVEHLTVLCLLQLKGIRTVIDIGANRGQFALAARHAFPASDIISFEPLQEAADTFHRIFADDHAITLQQVAIGEQEAQAQIHVSQSDDSSSLLPISDLQNSLFPNTAEKEARPVTVKRLENVIDKESIQPLALLKIDVQGMEKQVLTGIGSWITLFHAIYVECSFMELYCGQALADEIIAYLQGKGFKLQGIYNISYDRQGSAIQGDFLFSRNPEKENTSQ